MLRPASGDILRITPACAGVTTNGASQFSDASLRHQRAPPPTRPSSSTPPWCSSTTDNPALPAAVIHSSMSRSLVMLRRLATRDGKDLPLAEASALPAG